MATKKSPTKTRAAPAKKTSKAPASRSASATKRTQTLNSLLEENHHVVADDGKRDATIEHMIGTVDLDVPDNDGKYVLHAAAMRGDAALFRKLYAVASTKLPRIAAPISTTLRLAVSPAGGVYPTVRYPAGAAPITVAR